MKSDAVLALGCIYVAAVLLSGCAILVLGKSERLVVESKPEGAKVFCDGEFVGTTPTSVKVKRGDYPNFFVDLPGYDPVTFRHKCAPDVKSFMISYIGCVPTLGIGFLVDYGNDMFWRHFPKETYLALNPKEKDGNQRSFGAPPWVEQKEAYSGKLPAGNAVTKPAVKQIPANNTSPRGEDAGGKSAPWVSQPPEAKETDSNERQKLERLRSQGMLTDEEYENLLEKIRDGE